MTLINVAGVAIGSLIGLAFGQSISPARQQQLKAIIGALMVFAGLKLVWLSMNGAPLAVARQVFIMLLAMTLGKLLGRALHLQKLSNRAGQFANAQFKAVGEGRRLDWNSAFLTGVAAFCGGALPVLGAVQAGLSDYWPTLAIKTAVDALAAMAFAQVLGWGVGLSALAVFAYQGTFTLLAVKLEPWLAAHSLTDSINAVGGMLVFCVAMVIFELKKIELADYLPALLVAPAITYYWNFT
jgi:uncharacterized membrane protein YqgA involved in biofilm formation